MVTLGTITVFGSSQPRPGSVAYEQARLLGRLLAEAGFAVANGGYSGTMQGVSQGAVEAGGEAIGVTCAAFDGARPGGNAYLSRAVHTPDLLARLQQLTECSDGFVVLGGGVGTLLELFLTWNLLVIGIVDKPCVLVGAHWRRVLAALERETEVGPRHVAVLQVVDTPQEAVAFLEAAIGHTLMESM
jgi:uncharacterized protein (TIGR00730 family)